MKLNTQKVEIPKTLLSLIKNHYLVTQQILAKSYHESTQV